MPRVAILQGKSQAAKEEGSISRKESSVFRLSYKPPENPTEGKRGPMDGFIFTFPRAYIP